MADSGPEINDDFNSSFYGFMSELGPQQNNGDLSDWIDNVDLNLFDSGTTTDAAPQQATSGLEAHVSPDSRSSGGSGGTSLPQTDPETCVTQDHHETSSGSPDGNTSVSGSVRVEPGCLGLTETENNTSTVVHDPPTAPEKSSSTAVSTTKGKVRVAFSERQLDALVQRFNVQRYLTPAEMKDLAGMTGLTYKQVKTWFQNRRMKLKRQQKDNTWLGERSNIRDGPIHGAMNNHHFPSNVPPYQGQAQTQFREHYNHHVMQAPFRQTAQQNTNFYLPPMGSAAGSAAYTPWSSSTSQTVVPNQPQMAAWSIPPGVGHYEFNTTALNSASTNNF
ncbi:hypothetical protein Q5P01_000931 [Channa striata]|uniref:Homeobox domain-containing protein n=1 Tax=Channa striata TaxID=64152 RepID=A0AA88IR87_CHASR|nr:hypothetical protein Q5P01_000931 [Channa striata]